MEKRDFFISYTSQDLDTAVWIANTLTQHGYTVYIQIWDSPSGDSWVSWINDAIKNSHNFISVWSYAYSQSEHCKAEFETAYKLWIDKKIGKFLPVRIENHQIEPLYQRIGRVDLFSTYSHSERTQLLLQAIGYKSNIKVHRPNQNKRRSKKNSSLLILALMLFAFLWMANKMLLAQSGDGNSTNLHVKYLEKAAEGGSVSALVSLGQIYRNGAGVEQNYEIARNYFERAEALGSVDALVGLGMLYQFGESVEKDFEEARSYYQRAADAGNASGYYQLAFLYMDEGTTQDYEKARNYFEKAAEMGDAEALNALGHLYQNGFGLEIDYGKALYYYNLSADRGSITGIYSLGYLYQNGLGVDEDYEKAKDYYEKAAEKGFPAAFYQLAYLYYYGLGVEENEVKAREYYEKAAEKGINEAFNNLGYLYANQP